MLSLPRSSDLSLYSNGSLHLHTTVPQTQRSDYSGNEKWCISDGGAKCSVRVPAVSRKILMSVAVLLIVPHEKHPQTMTEARVGTDAEKRHDILESNQKLSTPTGCPIVKSKSGVGPPAK